MPRRLCAKTWVEPTCSRTTLTCRRAVPGRTCGRAENVQLHYNLGLAYKLKDDLPASVKELKYAEELDPQLPDPHYTLGVIEMQQGDFTQAKAQLEQVVALQPANGDAWSVLGPSTSKPATTTRPKEALRRAIALLPEQPSPHITLASILARAGREGECRAERKIAAN